MSNTMLFILLASVALFASAIMIITHRTEKRGCGRGCATCPNRSMCHKKSPGSKKAAK